MKTGRTLNELAEEITRQAEVKKDYIADTQMLSFVTLPDAAGSDVQLRINAANMAQYPLRDSAHEQVAERLQIPRKYYDRMLKDAPQLLALNANHWFANNPERRMVRTLDGNVRAFLSDRYARIDNYDVANVTLPLLAEIPGIRTVSTEITESRMYIKAVTSEISADVQSRRVGDKVEAGVMISNSETGRGALSVKPFAYFLFCLNGAVRDKGFRAMHIGRKQEEDEISALLSDDTKRLEDKAVLAKVRDVVRACFDETRFRAWIDTLNNAATQPINQDLMKAVEITAQIISLNEGEKSSVLRHLIEGADLSRYGMFNAVTRTAEDSESYDRATELETLGASIIELPSAQWREISKV